MLDDLKYVHQRDKSDALGVAEKQWQQLKQVYQLELKVSQIKNIVFAGMGGSALAAVISKTWPGYTVPFEIVRSYEIPSFVNENTLFIASSYSGNTEETLSALAQAEEKGANIVIITSGGKLHEIAEEKGYSFELLPDASQPRFGVFYSLKALVTILEKAGFVDSNSANDALGEAAEFLKTSVESWRPDVPAGQNVAKQIALELVGKSPVIYGGTKMFPAAYKWKINMNENAKNVAWCNEFPEFNHNEFLGWSSHPLDKPYKPVFLQSNYDHPQVTKRFEVTKKLLSGKMPQPIIINAKGETLLEQLVWAITLGDFVSLYLALLNNLDPSPVELIEKLKKEL